MRVLVTGADGFIGRHLLRCLASEGARVLALDMREMRGLGNFTTERIRWDIRNAADIPRLVEYLKGGVDACVHLAAIAAPREAERDPQLAWETNVRGTQNVLTLAREIGARKLVFASSAHVYGISPRYLPTDENHPLALLDTYTTTKIVGEQLCRLYHDNYGISTTWLRLFNAYGPGQSNAYFLGAKLEQAMREDVTLMNGQVTKDWVWVEDVVQAFAKALQTDFVGPINVGTGVETDLQHVAQIVATSFNRTLRPLPDRDNSPTRMCCDFGRARQVLDWYPTVSIEQGLARLISDRKDTPSQP